MIILARPFVFFAVSSAKSKKKQGKVLIVTKEIEKGRWMIFPTIQKMKAM
jgi:hypothetical protein